MMPTQIRKYYLFLLLGLLFSQFSRAQLSINEGETDHVIDFDIPLAGVVIGPYRGIGFSENPSANELNSNAWATTGMSEGDTDFGFDYTGGDFGRGLSEGNVDVGGFYGFLVAPDNVIWGFQQTPIDFTPGSITLRMVNNTGEYIEDMDLNYKIWENNNGDYSSNYNLSFSKDDISYVSLSDLDHRTPIRRDNPLDPSDFLWNTIPKDTVIEDLVLAPGDYFYLRWSSDSVDAYTGLLSNEQFDEVGFDEISVNVTTTTNPAPVFDSIVFYAYPTSSDVTLVTAYVTDPNNAIATNGVVLKYGTSSGSYSNTVNMTLISGNEYAATIPAQADGTKIYFTIDATDEANATRSLREESFDVRNAVTATLPYYQPFDTDLGDCYPFSVLGETKFWTHNTYSDEFSTYNTARMSGHNSREREEDWLILPGFDFSGTGNHAMFFQTYFNFGNDKFNTFDLLYSEDYPGTGDPSNYNWTALDFTKPINKQVWIYSDIVDLSALSSSNAYIAFRYINENNNYREWLVDDIIVVEDFQESVEPPNYPTNFTATAVNGSTIDISWSDVIADSAITQGYTILANTTGVFTYPVDGTPVDDDLDLEDGVAVRNIFYGFESTSITGALPNTTYYFIIFPYSNSGDLINYKIDGLPPEDTTKTPAGSSAVFGDVIFSEFMAAPGPVEDSDGEWIEVYNTTSNAIDINGWSINSTSSGGPEKYVIRNGGPLLIPAKSFFMFGLNEDTDRNGGVPIDYEYKNIFMSNTFDTVSIVSDANVEISLIEWGAAGAGWDIIEGASLTYVGLPAEDNNSGSNWFASLFRENGYLNNNFSDLGSPGTNGLFQNLIETTTWTGTGFWSEGNLVGNTNWSNGAPGRYVDVLVEGNVTIDLPTILPALCAKLTVTQPLGLVLPPNSALTIE